MLPEGRTHLFPDLLKYLEDEKTQLGITTLGVQPTTMEDVFIKVYIAGTIKQTTT